LLISIGMPVYNGESELEAAIKSLLSQTIGDFELIISDNCSTDSTQNICERYAELDDRIKYFRQETNLGAMKNFHFVLQEAKGRYFLWAAADDTRSNDFLELNSRFLEKSPDYVASTSPTRFENGEFCPVEMGDASLDGELEDRYIKFFRSWHSNGRFYSLFRTAAIRTAFKEDFYLASDWAIVIALLEQGKCKRLEDGSVLLGGHGDSNSYALFSKVRSRWIHWFFPFERLGRFLYRSTRSFSWTTRRRLAYRVFRLNCRAVRKQIYHEWMLRYHERSSIRDGPDPA
jgi:glycosyltransferase involved in cell wall biosynthesis